MQHACGIAYSPHSRLRLRAVVTYLFVAFVLCHATRARIVGDSDPNVIYDPPQTESNGLCTNAASQGCTNQWFEENISGAYKGAVKTTQGPIASLRFTFRGSMIVVKGVTDQRGASAIFTLDNGSSTTNSTKSDQQQVNAILFSAMGLQANIDHTLNITYDPTSALHRRPRLLRIDSFEIDEDVPVQSTDNQQFTPPLPTPSNFPEPSSTSSPDGTSTTRTGGSSSPAVADRISSTNSTTAPIIAGLVTGVATLMIASAVIFFILRRRRAVRIKSMQLSRSASTPQAPPPKNMAGLSNLVYAFDRRGSSVGSSADAPQPTLPVPPVTRVSPYNYQRPGPAYPFSEDSTSIGPPVDERPPNVPTRQPSATQSPRVLRVYNPDKSVVSSNY